jgi:hypothetical protein
MGCKHHNKEEKKPDRKFKINWKIYDLAMKHEDTWFIHHAQKIIEQMPEPWESTTMGRPPKHPAKPQVLALLLKMKHRKTYRELESYLLEDDRYKRLGFTSPPGKSTLQEAMEKVPVSYLVHLESELSTVLKKRKSTSL